MAVGEGPAQGVVTYHAIRSVVKTTRFRCEMEAEIKRLQVQAEILASDKEAMEVRLKNNIEKFEAQKVQYSKVRPATRDVVSFSEIRCVASAALCVSAALHPLPPSVGL